MLSEKYAKTFRVSLDAIKQQRGDGAAALPVDQLSHRADFQIPVGALDMLELSHRFHEVEPLPDVLIRSRKITLVHTSGSFLCD